MVAKIRTPFMRAIIAGIIKKALYKKLGYKVDIQLNSLSLVNDDGRICLHTDVELELTNDEMNKILKDNDLI